MKLVVLFLFIYLVSFELGAAYVPNSFVAKYKQERHSRISDKVSYSTGTLSYLYPSYLKFVVETPDREETYSTPSRTIIHIPPMITGQKSQVTISKTGKIAPAKFFDQLRKGLKTNKSYSVQLVSKRADLLFTSKIQKASQLKKAVLFFKNKHKNFIDLERVEIELVNSKKMIIVLTSINVTKSLTKKDFQFNIPPGALIQK